MALAAFLVVLLVVGGWFAWQMVKLVITIGERAPELPPGPPGYVAKQYDRTILGDPWEHERRSRERAWAEYRRKQGDG